MKISRKDAIKILDKITGQDDPYWEQIVEDWWDEETDDLPGIQDVFEAIGITKQEMKEILGWDIHSLEAEELIIDLEEKSERYNWRCGGL